MASSVLDSHKLPHLELRAPVMPGGTVGPLVDRAAVAEFVANLVNASGVKEPTVLIVNLEGRFPAPAVLIDLVVPLGEAASRGTRGPLAVVFVTSDDATRGVLKALAEAYDLAIFIAPAVDRLRDGEPAGALTATDHATLEVLQSLGGRATVARFAQAAGLEASAATNRLVSLQKKGFLHRVERSRRDGSLYLDPRAASQTEDPADPTSGDFELPEALRRDVRALTEAQVKEPGAPVADAFRELLTSHREQFAEDHAALQAAMRRGDTAEVARLSKRYARKQAQARATRLGR